MKDAFGAAQSVLIFGGTSEIGLATARRLAQRRARSVVLAGRDSERLEAARLALAGSTRAHVDTVSFDATDVHSHEALVDRLWDQHGDFDVVMFAFGLLGMQSHDEEDPEAALQVIDVNFRSAVSLGIPVVKKLRAQGHGTLVIMSSVAGERPRRANFVYGASKAGLDAFFQGLADSLVGSGVHVMVVRPGFVRTRMTEGMAPAPLATTADRVASDIVQGIGRASVTVWSPALLRPLMSVMRHLPRPIFRKLRA